MSMCLVRNYERRAILVIQASKYLSSAGASEFAHGFYEVNRLLDQVEQLKPPNDPAIILNETMDILIQKVSYNYNQIQPLRRMMDDCDTSCILQRGGRSTTIKEDESGYFKV
ncbi:hypothetical protein EIK77_007933 [Talaromyces pinophilus]|nr:hypothetical protein EIK77_007933 [Talaromyces pinophilus]